MYSLSRPRLRPAVWLLIVATGLLFLTGCAGATVTSNWAGLSTDGTKVYVAFGPRVLAYDPATDEQTWIYPDEDSGVSYFSAPSTEDGRVIFGDYGRPGGFFSPRVTTSVYALQETETGSTASLWTNSETAGDKIVAPPLQVGDVVYVGTADNYIVAMDATSGSPLWSYETGHAIWGQPAYRDGIVYVASMDWSVYALDAENGEVIWTTPLGGALASRPVLGEDLLYVSSFDNHVHALDIATGEERWQAAATDWVWSAPALDNGTIYFGDISGDLFAVDAATGEQKWTQPTDVVVQTSPVVSGDKLYVASERSGDLVTGALTAFDTATGQQLWTEATPAPLYATPVIVGETIIVAPQSADTLLIGYDLEDGQERLRLPMPQTAN